MRNFTTNTNGKTIYFRDIKTQKTTTNKQTTKDESPLFLVFGLLFFFLVSFVFSYALLTQSFFPSFVLSSFVCLLILPIFTTKK